MTLKKANDFGRIIEAFVAKEMKPYVTKFPPEYYREICRLRGIPYDPESVRRPSYFGHLTNRITYLRLAPGVWKELKEKSKKSTSVTRPHLHRFLTDDVGDPRLRDVISKNVAVMQLSDNWFDFIAKTLQLSFDNSKDDGVGL